MSQGDALTAPGSALPWHDALWTHLADGLKANRVAHGLLFCGPAGVGKRRLAGRMAAAVICRQRLANGDACGLCPGCRQREAGTHPDISRLVPEEPGKRIKVEQVRRFTQALHLTPQYDTGRLGWIDPADALTISAANSLLKTLEEPPAGCHILLITDRLSTLLPTIRSRCQQWQVPSAAPETARAWLSAQGVAGDDAAIDRLRTPLQLVSAHESGLAERVHQWDQDLARLLARRANPVSVAERAAKADRREWVDWLYRRTADLLIASLAADDDVAGLEPAIASAARRVGASALKGWSYHVGELARRVDANADWQLMLESLLIDLSHRVAEAGRQ